MDRLEVVKTILEIANDEQDILLNAYLNLAEAEAISWRYALVGIPEELPDTSVWDGIIIQAVINGYGTAGTEGQTSHDENGVNRTWKYEDMIAYIHAHITQFARVQ